MGLVLRNSPTYVLTDMESILYLRNTPVYALVDDPILLPRGVTGKESVLNLVKALNTKALDFAKTTLGPPSTKAGQSINTEVSLSAGSGLPYSGTVEFVYNRVPLAQEISRISGSLSLNGVNSSHELIDQINTVSGLVLVTEDLELTQVTDGKLALRAAATSYFFIPGSSITLG